MSTSFEEKSVWIQLTGISVAYSAYFVIAGRLLLSGVNAMPSYAALFMTAVVLMTIYLVVAHILAAIATRRPEPPDERDRIITWRAEHHSSWLAAVGVLAAVTCMTIGVENVWTANILLLSLVLSEVLALVLRLIAYRRGIRQGA